MSTLIQILERTKINETGCLEWQGPRDWTGYGAVSAFGKKMNTHRAVMMFIHGELPAKTVVCHKCDNKCCVNPEHLFLGTQKDNMLDSRLKGRSRKTDHGRIGMWNANKCQCGICKQASSLYYKKRYQRRKNVVE